MVFPSIAYRASGLGWPVDWFTCAWVKTYSPLCTIPASSNFPPRPVNPPLSNRAIWVFNCVMPCTARAAALVLPDLRALAWAWMAVCRFATMPARVAARLAPVLSTETVTLVWIGLDNPLPPVFLVFQSLAGLASTLVFRLSFLLFHSVKNFRRAASDGFATFDLIVTALGRALMVLCNAPHAVLNLPNSVMLNPSCLAWLLNCFSDSLANAATCFWLAPVAANAVTASTWLR